MRAIRDEISQADKNDQPATCLVLSERYLRHCPDDLRVQAMCARQLALLNRYDQAVSVYTEMYRHFPRYRYHACNQLGLLHRQRGSFEDAEHWHRQALEEDPADASALIFLGSLRARRGDLNASEDYHRRATRCREGCIDEAFLNLGLVLRGQGRFREAAECFRQALELDPDDSCAQTALEDVTFAMRFAPARRRLSMCRHRQYSSSGGLPNLTDPALDAIRSAHRDGRAMTVVLLAQQWLQDHPDDLWMIFDYAETLYMLTRYEEAVSIYASAIAQFAEHRWALFNQLARLHQYRADFPEAERWIHRAIAEDPEEARSYLFVGELQAARGDLTAAELTLRGALNCVESPNEVMCDLGLVLRSQGRYEESAECLRQAVALCPDFEIARTGLADVTRVLHLLDEAA